MMKYLQKLGKSLMLPVACLPVAAILMGVGYWIDPTGWGANNVAAAFLIKAGGAIIENMAILFAIGVGVGMSKDGDGTAALAALVCWLVIQTLLSPSAYAMFVAGLKGIDVSAVVVPAAFSRLNNQFIGIISGLIGATCYNKFHQVQLHDALSFFSGRRCVAIVSALCSLVAALILAVLWPLVYQGLVSFGQAIVASGAVGAGIYGFANRMLIPVGLHHALNSVFWFDVAGINDIGNFWSGKGTLGVTGQYMTGFFPMMMFGMPAACLAMYHTAKTARKKAAAGLLLSAGLSAFFVGITEPIEFAFMFLAPVLYIVHAILTGISLAVCALLPVRCGFNFSAGFIDWFLSFKAPLAVNPLYVIPLGVVYFALYYAVFRFLIVKLNLQTPGREEDTEATAEENAADLAAEKSALTSAGSDFARIAEICVAGLGGKDNIASSEHCATRLRFEVKNSDLVDDKKIKSAKVAGVIKPSKDAVQIIIGTKVQFVYDEVKKLL